MKKRKERIMESKLKRSLNWGIVLFLLALLLIPAVSIQAAEKKPDIVNSYSKTTGKIDLDGDGKKEVLKIKTKEDGIFITKAVLYIDGKEALKFDDLWDFFVTIDYIKMSASKIFIRCCISGDSDIAAVDSFYKYDASRKKLIKAGNLLDVQAPCASAAVKNVKSSEITILYERQFPEIGSVKWVSTYVCKNGKLELKKNAVKAASCYKANSDSDTYGKLFEKNKYKAVSNIKLYKSTAMDGLAYTAKAGDVLKLQKIKYVNHRYYVQFSKGNKKGWLKVDSNNGEPLFYGVYYRLAG